jgi:hypothetical protein
MEAGLVLLKQQQVCAREPHPRQAFLMEQMLLRVSLRLFSCRRTLNRSVALGCHRFHLALRSAGSR